jgi:hypothetical protein
VTGSENGRQAEALTIGEAKTLGLTLESIKPGMRLPLVP